MCVAQFREYCKASRFQIDAEYGGDESFDKDIEDENLQVSDYIRYYNDRGECYQAVYYRTDLTKMKNLAEMGNEYAKNHLDNACYMLGGFR